MYKNLMLNLKGLQERIKGGIGVWQVGRRECKGLDTSDIQRNSKLRRETGKRGGGMCGCMGVEERRKGSSFLTGGASGL
jgi:hypothetical protein